MFKELDPKYKSANGFSKVPKLSVLVVGITFPPTRISPPTYKFLPMPTPPVTINAADCVDVALVLLDMVIIRLVLDPLEVTVCNVLLFHTVILPVDVLTEVSVPAANVSTPVLEIVIAPVDDDTLIPVPAVILLTNPDPVPPVNTACPLLYIVPPT